MKESAAMLLTLAGSMSGVRMPICRRITPKLPGANQIRVRGVGLVDVPSQSDAEAFCRAEDRKELAAIRALFCSGNPNRGRELMGASNSRRLIAERRKACRSDPSLRIPRGKTRAVAAVIGKRMPGKRLRAIWNNVPEIHERFNQDYFK